MKYAIMITGAPDSGALAKAYQFCQSCLSDHHTIRIVFFYQDAVRVVQQDLIPWQALKLPYHLCSTSVLKNHISETDGFTISGLGSWAQEMMNADCIVVFNDNEAPVESCTLSAPKESAPKTLVACIHIAPEPYERAEGLLNQILAYAAFEYPLTVVFEERGLLQLLDPRLAPQWSMLPDYDVTELYTTEKTLERCNLTLSELPLILKIISPEELFKKRQSAHWVINHV